LSVIVSFRIPKQLKERMDKLRGKVDWSEEVRRFLEEKVREYEQLEAIRELEEAIRSLPKVPRGTALGYVRGNRDSR